MLTNKMRRSPVRKSLICCNGLLSKHQGEALIHTSVGHRPTIGCDMIFKAVGLVHFWVSFFMCKAFSLDYFFSLLRRALPYAGMCKTFGLMGRIEKEV